MIKWIFSICALFILGMLYWSSLLVEKDLKDLRGEIEGLKKAIAEMTLQPTAASTSSQKKERPLLSSEYPNLLSEDPFYQKTLKTLLGEKFSYKGVREEDLLGHPEHLHPFNGFRDVSSLIGLCSVSLASSHFGKYETFAPAAAIKIEARPRKDKPDVPEYWVHLRDDLFWQPINPSLFPENLALAEHFQKKHPVTAYDFKFYFDAVMNPYISEPKAAALRNYIGDIEEFEVIDPLTFVVRWKAVDTESGPQVKYSAFSLTCGLQPLPTFLYQYFPDGKKIVEEDSDVDTYRNNSIWAQNFSNHFAKNIIPSCGPWIFAGMNEEGISFKRNPNFFDPLAVLVEGLHYTFRQSSEAIWQDCKSAAIDATYLAPTQVAEFTNFLKSPLYESQLEKGLKINELKFVDAAYSYIGWNQTTPFFCDKECRLAMTLAIDRNRIISQNLNDMGIAVSGPFFCFSPSYNAEVTPWPFNPEEAKRLLENAGWIDRDNDGIREKIIDGKKVLFRFSLLYYAKNLTTKSVCDYIATALREIGVCCNPNGLDITDLSHAFEDKTFDAIAFAWALGTPPEDPKQLWHSAGAKEKGSSNAIGFQNKRADQIIEKLQYEYNPEKRKELYHSFHRIIHEEAPYTFLYSQKRQLLYRDYVRNIFIPRERQDLVPGAVTSEPDFHVIYLEP